MRVTFTDLQDQMYSLNGTVIKDDKRLLQIMDGLVARDPFAFELACDNGYYLMVGMGGPVGSVEYCHCEAKISCLSAMTIESKHKTGYIDFLAGNTPTPIPARYCIPFELVKHIAAYFLNTGERSPAASWEVSID